MRETRREQGARAERSVPIAHDGLEDKHREVVGRLPRNALNGESKVAGGRGIVTDSDFGTNKVGLGRRGQAELDGTLADGKAAEVLLGKLDERVVLDTTSADKNHTVSSVVGLDVLSKVLALDGENVLLGAQDCAAKGLTLEGNRVQVVKDDLLLELVNLLLFTEDHIALALNGRVFELGVLENVGDDVNGLVDVLAESFGIVDGLLSGGVGVKVGTEVLDFELKGMLRSLASS